jgi:hypothetical protein
MNTSNDARPVEFKKYAERTTGFTKAFDVLSNNSYNTSDDLVIPAKEMWVLELN